MTDDTIAFILAMLLMFSPVIVMLWMIIKGRKRKVDHYREV